MASLDRRIVFAIALTAACSSDPRQFHSCVRTCDSAGSDADARAGAMTSGSAGAASGHASGGTDTTSSTGGSLASAGRGGATGGKSARGGSTSGNGDTGGTGDAAGEAATGGSSATTGGGGTDSTGGTGGSNQGGSGGDLAPAGTGGGGTGGSAGSGTASGGTAGLGTGGLGSGAGTGGTLPVAGAPNGGSGDVVGGCDNQLLANASFEAGPGSAWVEQSTWPGLEIIVATSNSALQMEGVVPYAGNYLGWLGGIPDNDWDHHLVELTQEVTLPADAATLTLSGRRYVKSVEDSSDVFDVAFLEFDDEAEDVVWQAQAWTNQSTTNGWVSFESTTTVMPALRGTKLTFVAYSNTDPDGKTSFFLDDLRLVASCGR